MSQTSQAPRMDDSLLKGIENKEVKLNQTAPKPTRSELLSEIRGGAKKSLKSGVTPKSRDDLLSDIRTGAKKSLKSGVTPKSREDLLSDIRTWKRENCTDGKKIDGSEVRDRSALLSDIRKHMKNSNKQE